MRGENYILQYFCRTDHREIDICSRIQVAILGVDLRREVFYSLTFCSVRLLLPAVTTFTERSGKVFSAWLIHDHWFDFLQDS